MNKTVYLRDSEISIWEKARELAKDKLSHVIVEALKKFISEKQSALNGYKRIEISFNDHKDNDLPKRKAFQGRWLISIEDPLFVTREDSYYSRVYAVAETQKGAVAIYSHLDFGDGAVQAQFWVYPSFESAARNPEVNIAVVEALSRQGVPVEELDI